MVFNALHFLIFFPVATVLYVVKDPVSFKNDFADITHLTPLGAEKFSRLLDRDIIKEHVHAGD